MKKLSYLMLTSLLIAGLAGCNTNSGKKKELTDQEIAQEAVNNPALLLSQGGSIVYANTTTQMKAGDYFICMNTYDYSEDKKVEISWSFDKADKWTASEYKKDASRTIYTPATIYEAKDEYKTTITATAKFNEATASTTFYAYMNRLQVEIKSIKSYREDFAAKKISGSDNIRFFGYVTGKMGDTRTGVYVQSGNYAVMLYNGNLEAQWTANNLKVGDLVDVMGKASPYNGLFEVNPQWVKKANTSEIPIGYDLSEPVVNEIPYGGFNATDLALKDGSLGSIDELRYLGAGGSDSKPEIGKNEFDASSHAYIWFSTELVFKPAFITTVDKVTKAYRNRTGTGTSADPYVYTEEVEIKSNSYAIDAGGGNTYRANADGVLEKIDMSKRIDYNKGYFFEGKAYSDQEHKKEVAPTYGGVFLDLADHTFYISDYSDTNKALEFVETNMGDKVEMEVEIPCYYNYHQASSDGSSIAEMLEEWTVRDVYANFNGVISWYNGPNLAPIGGADCFSALG